jgi:hypothetical protein
MPPPPQLPLEHVPQCSSPPQPSAIAPQVACCAAQLVGVQPLLPPHWLAVPPPPQVWGGVQGPQSTQPPQPSPIGPQVACSSMQVFGTQTPASSVRAPQTFGVPEPPQACVAVQVPHMSRLPQPSAIGPQVAPTEAQVRAVQMFGAEPQRLATPPPPQDSLEVQVPHWSRPPQPSPTGPQFARAVAQVSGVHAPPSFGTKPPSVATIAKEPQRFAPPRPQDSVAEQVPQLSELPQPSPSGPQFAFALAQVLGWQALFEPHWLSVAPPPQVSGSWQLPQLRTLPQPSPIGPQVAFAFAQVLRPQPPVLPPSSPESSPTLTVPSPPEPLPSLSLPSLPRPNPVAS